jgi:hypothetical protein
MSDLTHILSQIESGDPSAAEQRFRKPNSERPLEKRLGDDRSAVRGLQLRLSDFRMPADDGQALTLRIVASHGSDQTTCPPSAERFGTPNRMRQPSPVARVGGRQLDSSHGRLPLCACADRVERFVKRLAFVAGLPVIDRKLDGRRVAIELLKDL